MSIREISFQEILKKKLEEKNLNINAAEAKLGLKKSAIRNIIIGRSKNPGIEVLQAIASELGCTIEELLGKEKPINTQEINPQIQNKSKKEEENLNKELNYNLFIGCCDVVIEELKRKNIIISHKSVINYINTVYWFSLKKDNSKVDIEFTQWLIEEKSL